MLACPRVQWNKRWSDIDDAARTALGHSIQSDQALVRINVCCCTRSDQIADKSRMTKRASWATLAVNALLADDRVFPLLANAGCPERVWISLCALVRLLAHIFLELLFIFGRYPRPLLPCILRRDLRSCIVFPVQLSLSRPTELAITPPPAPWVGLQAAP